MLGLAFISKSVLSRPHYFQAMPELCLQPAEVGGDRAARIHRATEELVHSSSSPSSRRSHEAPLSLSSGIALSHLSQHLASTGTSPRLCKLELHERLIEPELCLLKLTGLVEYRKRDKWRADALANEPSVAGQPITPAFEGADPSTQVPESEGLGERKLSRGTAKVTFLWPWTCCMWMDFDPGVSRDMDRLEINCFHLTSLFPSAIGVPSLLASAPQPVLPKKAPSFSHEWASQQIKQSPSALSQALGGGPLALAPLHSKLFGPQLTSPSLAYSSGNYLKLQMGHLLSFQIPYIWDLETGMTVPS